MQKVELFENYIYVRLSGDIDHNITKSAIEQTVGMITKMEEQNKPVYILADITGLKKTDFTSAIIAGKSIKDLSEDKIAVIGAGEESKMFVKKAIEISENKTPIKFFSSKEKALKWLGV